MAHEHRIGRRGFLRATTGAFATGLTLAGGTSPLGWAAPAGEIEEAAARVGRLPRRSLGGSSRKISVLVGAGTWASEAVEAGVRCDVNFWHKADRWRNGAPEGILKNREAHYCEVCVDRVRGNHETGEINEEAHYQKVKRSLAETGLRYYDDMMFHFGFHTVQEAKNDRGVIRAYERLKKEGLVRHLCLSQHNYQGNTRVPGGQSAAEILSTVLQDGLFEHAQFFYSYGENGSMEEFVRRARQKGFGTIAMKTTRGAGRMVRDRELMKGFPSGTTPYHALARWLTTRTELDAAVVEINSLDEFVDTYSGAGKPLRAADVKAIERLAAYADREVCRLCNDCQSHCPQGLPIADVLRYERYARDYQDRTHARQLYARLETRADACTACGKCIPHCPQGLPIPDVLLRAHGVLA
jgi:predicted aldo/keto reductase-like oxidoreductase